MGSQHPCKLKTATFYYIHLKSNVLHDSTVMAQTQETDPCLDSLVLATWDGSGSYTFSITKHKTFYYPDFLIAEITACYVESSHEGLTGCVHSGVCNIICCKNFSRLQVVTSSDTKSDHKVLLNIED